MQIAIFTIPLWGGEQELERCNALLGSVKVLRVEKQFVDRGEYSVWSILVEYIEAKKDESKKFGKDYKEILSQQDFELYLSLRKRRKELSEEHGVPIASVFTNEQLAQIAEKKISSKNALMQLSGVGEKKAENYGSILELVKAQDE